MDEPPNAPDPAGPEGQEAEANPLDAPAVPFLDRRSRARPLFESAFVRLVATTGIVGICVAVAAILGTQSIHAWVIGLVVSVVSVILAAILWSSRTL
jgi:protein-S-isoprenylcysteine O-methyltransferase Ste14